MTITRAQIVGALKLCNRNQVSNRRGFIQNMLAVEYRVSEVAKALRDLDSYPEWAEGATLDAVGGGTAADDAAVVVGPKPKPKKKK